MNMRSQIGPRSIRLGNLDAIEVPSNDPKALTCVVMHGYGADMRDLGPLAPEIPAGRSVRWIFPDAPEVLDGGGRAWFPLDVAAFEEAYRSGRPHDLFRHEPNGMSASRNELGGLIEALDVPWSSLVLIGFSQGAMMAVDLAIRAPMCPAGIAILAGTLVDRNVLATLAPKQKGLRFFQSHGSDDPILSFQEALALERELQIAGWNGNLHRFEGTHENPPEIVSELGRWLKEL